MDKLIHFVVSIYSISSTRRIIYQRWLKSKSGIEPKRTINKQLKASIKAFFWCMSVIILTAIYYLVVFDVI